MYIFSQFISVNAKKQNTYEGIEEKYFSEHCIKFNFSGINFPTTIHDIDHHFEHSNSHVSIFSVTKRLFTQFK